MVPANRSSAPDGKHRSIEDEQAHEVAYAAYVSKYGWPPIAPEERPEYRFFEVAERAAGATPLNPLATRCLSIAVLEMLFVCVGGRDGGCALEAGVLPLCCGPLRETR